MLDDITLTSIERIVLVIIPCLSLLVDFASYQHSMKSHHKHSETMKAYNEQIQSVSNGKQCAISKNTTYGNNSPITVQQDQKSTQYLATESIQSKRDTYAEAVSQQHSQRIREYYGAITAVSLVMAVIFGFLFLGLKDPLVLVDEITRFKGQCASFMTVLAIANIILCIGFVQKYNKTNDKPCRMLARGISCVAIVISLYTIVTIPTMNIANMIGTGFAVSVITAVLVSFLVSNVHFLTNPSTKYKYVVGSGLLCGTAVLLVHIINKIS